MKKKKKKTKNLGGTPVRYKGNESTNILHPSHWQSHLAMERRIRRRRKSDPLREEREQRQAQIDEYGELLGIFVERHGRSDIWHISDWWSGDLLLSFSDKSGRYELSDGESGSVPNKTLFHAMELAAGVQNDVVGNVLVPADSANLDLALCDFSRGWNVKDRATNQTLLRYVRKSSGSYQIPFPALFATSEFSFAEVIATAEMRKRVCQLGSVIELRDIESDEIETYLIAENSDHPTESPDIVATGWGSSLGFQIKGRRIGERFFVTLPNSRREYEVISLELGE